MKIYDISSWRIPTVAENIKVKERIKNGKGNNVSLAEFSSNLSSFELYTYLKARFGEPNATIMKSKSPDSSDSLTHWGFELLDNEYHVLILGMKSYVQFFYVGEQLFDSSDWITFSWDLRTDFKNYKTEIKTIEKTYKEWTLIYNPYRRVDHQIQFLENIISHIRSDMKNPLNSNNQEKWLSNNAGNLTSLFNDFYDACFTLNFLVPLKGEFFINAIFFMLAKKEVKEDINLFDRIIKQNIDVKIKLMHLYCDEFEKGIDGNNKVFKEFLSIYAKRNDTIHGNFRPNQQQFDTVYFDGNIPLFKKCETPLKGIYSKHLKSIEPKSVLDNLGIVRDFQDLLLGSIKRPVREKLLKALNKSELGWDKNCDELGILFPIVEGYVATPCVMYRDWEDDFSEIFQ